MTDELVLQPILTIPTMGRALIAHDPASRNYPVRGVLAQAGAPRVTRTWRRTRAPYDQGQTSSCVGQTLRGILDTSPDTAQLSNTVRKTFDGIDFYRNGQDYDEWPGREPQYYGTSALGVCKYLKARNIISEYRWCFGLDDVLDTLSQHGPVGTGLMWTKDMMYPTPDGFVRPTGEEVGGHETELLGINVKNKYVVGCNSWGPNWGLKGRFRISWDDLNTLLKNQGDAVTVVSVVSQ